MTEHEPMKDRAREPSIGLLRKQRSHVLIVLSNPAQGQESRYRDWYRESFQSSTSAFSSVLSAQQYERHEVDITKGRYPLIPFQYVAIYELSLDGAPAAEALIEHIAALHDKQSSAQPPATWLYYPACEKVGRSPASSDSMLILAFANGTPGQESEFREWYATRHIRHALIIPAVVSGQCLERTHFQRPGAADASYATIAVYEQEGTPEDVIESFRTLPEGALYFPMLDRTRFTEWVFKRFQ